MPQIGHFQAWIDVENEQLLEYGVEYSADGKQATCWIPSETGKAFLICVKDSLRTQTCATKLFVDGLACGGTIMRPISTHPHRRSTCIHRGISVTDQAYRPFIFSNCELTEEESLNPLAIRPEIGDIKVVVNSVTTSKSRGFKPYKFTPLQVNERDKKGIVHGTKLGAELPRRQRKYRHTKTVNHIATFIFRYRPIAVLQADGIVPLPRRSDRHCHSTSALNNFIDLTVEDEDDASRQSKTLSVKREVKQERSVIFHGDIIDLTQEG